MRVDALLKRELDQAEVRALDACVAANLVLHIESLELKLHARLAVTVLLEAVTGGDGGGGIDGGFGGFGGGVASSSPDRRTPMLAALMLSLLLSRSSPG